MPIPIILGGIAAFGALAGGKAAIDNRKAKSTLESAQSWLEYHQKKMEAARETTNSALEGLGKVRIMTEAHTIAQFVELYGKVKKIEAKKINHKVGNLSPSALSEMRVASTKAAELADFGIDQLGKGVAAGIGAAGTTVGLITQFGVASTGTAISSLSGAAATNATLAWLGGGSLAAGGGGMAAGAAALGGLVAAPALAVIGFAAASKAAKALTAAKEKEAEIDVICEQIQAGIALLTTIDVRCAEIGKAISMLSRRLDRQMQQVSAWISERENRRPSFFKRLFGAKDPMSYGNFTPEEQNQFNSMVVLGMALNQLLRVPVMAEDGSLTQESQTVLDAAKTHVA